MSNDNNVPPFLKEVATTFFKMVGPNLTPDQRIQWDERKLKLAQDMHYYYGTCCNNCAPHIYKETWDTLSSEEQIKWRCAAQWALLDFDYVPKEKELQECPGQSN